MNQYLFDERRAAECAAYLLDCAGGTMDYLKLIKLMFLAERRSLERFGEPLTGDVLVSMTHGPVLSRTYDHIKGASLSVEGGWDDWVADKADYKVSLRKPLGMDRSALPNLSRSDAELLAETWKDYGHLTKWDLVEFTHTLPEWEDPHGSCTPIKYERIFQALGFDAQAAQDMTDRIEEQANLNRQFRLAS